MCVCARARVCVRVCARVCVSHSPPSQPCARYILPFRQREAEEERQARKHAEHLLAQAASVHVVNVDMAHEIEQASSLILPHPSPENGYSERDGR